MNRIPQGLLPIACDSLGNLLLLDIGAKRFGFVYFWDHEEEGDGEDDPTWNNISIVAPSFDRLISSLE